MSKYHSRRCEWAGQKFDSVREMRRYQELVLLEGGGIIEGLQRQVSYDLTVNGVQVARYVADFVYRENDRLIVEDVKSPITARNPVYRLKKRLMRACHNIEIRET